MQANEVQPCIQQAHICRWQKKSKVMPSARLGAAKMDMMMPHFKIFIVYQRGEEEQSWCGPSGLESLIPTEQQNLMYFFFFPFIRSSRSLAFVRSLKPQNRRSLETATLCLSLVTYASS